VIGQHEPSSNQEADQYPVTYLPGAFILARRELLDRIGGFWDKLFMYTDDVELYARATPAGAGIVIVPVARVWHFDPPALPVPGWLTALKVRNMLWLYIRHAPIEVLIPFVVRYCLDRLFAVESQ
jgi:GT2 family glycosyltransferase